MSEQTATPAGDGAARYRVAVDGFNLAIPRGTGVATYARSLSQCLAGLGHTVDLLYGLGIPAGASPAMREVEFFDRLETERGGWMPKYPSVGWGRQMLGAYRGATAFEIELAGRVIPGSLAARLPAHDRILNVTDLFSTASRYFRTFGRFMPVRIPGPAPAVMHWTYPVPVTLQGARNIYTIHDLVPLRLPHTTLDHKPTHLRLLTECLRRADHIVTVSETSRKDLLDFFPFFPSSRVTNTYQAVSLPDRLPNDAEVTTLLHRAFDLERGRYFLFFGSIEPKKNVGRLLEAYLSTSLDLPLVVIGARAWKSEAELALLQHRPAGDRRIRRIDYVPSDTLVSLIRGARAVAFPSLYEGFGLPLLEAMALGTPVLTSREGALPEVGGDAALYVNAYDPRDIAAGLQRLAEDDELCASMRERGLAQAQLFGMDRYRERIGTLYAGVIGPR